MKMFVNKVVFRNEVLYSWENLLCEASKLNPNFPQEVFHAHTH